MKIKGLNSYVLLSFVTAEVLVFYLSLTPRENVPEVGLPGIDKVVHFIFYFVLTRLGLELTRRYQSAAMMVLCLIGQGWLIEFLQENISNRHFDFYDGLFNGLGVLAGLVLWRKGQITAKNSPS